MSRPLRIEYPGAWYHVMNRGRRKEKIFLNYADRNTFLDLLKEAAELWKVNVAAYCLMPNHYHILINTPGGNLSRFMRHLNGVYTQKFNKYHKYDGQLFRGRFKSILVEGDSYLLKLLRYIHRNPVRAKLVRQLEDYKWSSHLGYLSNLKEWDWLYKSYMSGIFSDDRLKQKISYKNYIDKKEEEKILKLLGGKRWPVFFGSDEFIFWVKEKFYEEKRDREVPERKVLSPDKNVIKRIVCEVYGIADTDLNTYHQKRQNEPRDVAIYLSRILRNDTFTEISSDYGLNSPSSINSVIRKIKKSLDEDPKFKLKIEEVAKLCLKSQKQT